MGDITKPFVPSPIEAPFLWLLATGCSVAVSLLPLVVVFRSADSRAGWAIRRDSALPMFVERPYLYTAVCVFYAVTLALANWVSRGGHTFGHRVSVEVPFYACVLFTSVWSAPLAFFDMALASAALLAAAACSAVAFTVYAFISQPWAAGLVGAFATLALFVMNAFLWFSARGTLVHLGAPRANMTLRADGNLATAATGAVGRHGERVFLAL